MKHLQGFTLVELLTVIGIIVVLVGILFPVLASAKRNAQNVVEISQLKQLGVASALYSDQNDSAIMTRVDESVQSNLAPPALLGSPVDPTPDGMCNTVMKEWATQYPSVYEPLETPYRNSYFGIDNLSVSKYLDAIQGDPNGGNLVAISNLVPNEASLYQGFVDPMFPRESRQIRYKRLRLDGGVSSMILHPEVLVRGNTTALGIAYVLFFMDGTEPWRQSLFN